MGFPWFRRAVIGPAPKTVLVTGAGPIGLLGALVGRLAKRIEVAKLYHFNSNRDWLIRRTGPSARSREKEE